MNERALFEVEANTSACDLTLILQCNDYNVKSEILIQNAAQNYKTYKTKNLKLQFF